MGQPDDITLQRAKLNGLIQERDAISHKIAIEHAKLEMLIEEKRSEQRNKLCETE